jgi:hypothetical protein
MGRGERWEVGGGEARGPSSKLEGENKRGGGMGGLKPMCEGDGGCVGSAVRKFYWAEKFSYRTANPPPSNRSARIKKHYAQGA